MLSGYFVQKYNRIVPSFNKTRENMNILYNLGRENAIIFSS